MEEHNMKNLTSRSSKTLLEYCWSDYSTCLHCIALNPWKQTIYLDIYMLWKRLDRIEPHFGRSTPEIRGCSASPLYMPPGVCAEHLSPVVGLTWAHLELRILRLMNPHVFNTLDLIVVRCFNEFTQYRSSGQARSFRLQPAFATWVSFRVLADLHRS